MGWVQSLLGRVTTALFAASLATALLVGVAAERSSAAAIPLYPNLHTLAPRELKLDRADITPDLSGVFHNVLRFSNDTYNAGEGPLIVNAHIDPTTNSGPSTQRVMNSDGTFTDIALNNNIYWHQAHHHYHFDNWGRYQLWTKSAYDAWIASGRTTGAPSYTGVKTTSCITDEEFITSAPNAVYPGPFGLSGCDVDSQNNIHMGLSVGWGDTYDWYRQDQWIDLNQDTLANNTTYVLRSVADPLNIVYESAGKSDTTRESEADNEATTTFSTNSSGALVDSNPPTGTVSINHVDANTTNTNVSVDVVARDDVSGVNQFRLSNNGTQFTTFNYTSSGSVPTTVAWNLADAATGGSSTAGIHTVYAQAHDNAGNWGPTFTDSINLGTGPPPPPPPTGTYAQVVANDGPLSYWRLDETSGTNAADSKGSNPGTYTGSPTLGAASLLTNDGDKAATFSGSAQYVRVASSASLSLASTVSLEAWIKPTSIPAAGAFASVLTKPESYSLQFNGPKMEFTIMQAGTRRRLQTPAALVAGTAYHIVGTYDGTTQRLYINGALVASAALTGAITTNTNQLNIASWNGSSEFLAGTVDEAAVYPTVLSPTKIANHYSTGTTITTAASSSVSGAPAAITLAGSSPVATGVDDTLGRIYVTRNHGEGLRASNGVTVIDAATHGIVAEVTTGRWGPSSLAVDAVRHLVYVTAATWGSTNDHSVVVVIDGRTNRIVRRIPVGPGPKSIAVNAKTNRVYVADQSGMDAGQSLAVIDGATGRTIGVIPMGPYARYYENPLGLAVDSRSNTVYATNPLEGTLYIVDGATNTVKRALALGDEPTAVAVDSATGRAFVAHAGRGSAKVSVIDGRTAAVVRSIRVAGSPRGVAVDPHGGTAYVTTAGHGTVALDTATARVAGVLDCGPGAYGVTVSTTGTVIVADRTDEILCVLPRRTRAPIS